MNALRFYLIDAEEKNHTCGRSPLRLLREQSSAVNAISLTLICAIENSARNSALAFPEMESLHLQWLTNQMAWNHRQLGQGSAEPSMARRLVKLSDAVLDEVKRAVLCNRWF
jgi:hypothetical protein